MFQILFPAIMIFFPLTEADYPVHPILLPNSTYNKNLSPYDAVRYNTTVYLKPHHIVLVSLVSHLLGEQSFCSRRDKITVTLVFGKGEISFGTGQDSRIPCARKVSEGEKYNSATVM